MFGFNKNDPLIDAVKGAMQDGAIKREAEKIVNEEFGVYSRKALVLEDVAAYDAALEEVYQDLKEGSIEEAKKVYDPFTKKMVSRKPVKVKMGGGTTRNGVPVDFDKEGEKKDEPKLDMKAREKAKSDYSKMREKMVGKGKDLETTRKIVGEEQIDEISKNLAGRYAKKSAISSQIHVLNSAQNQRLGQTDGTYNRWKRRADIELGKSAKRARGLNLAVDKLSGKAKVNATEEIADKDYDKDGKIESGKAEYQGSRIRAAKMAGKLEESMSHEARELSTYADNDSSLYRQSHQPIIKNLQRKHDKGSYDHAKAEKLWGYHAKRAADSYSKKFGGKFSVAHRKEAAKHMADRARDEHGFGSVKEEHLEELKQSTIRSYIDKAHARASSAKSGGFKKDFTEKKGKKAAGSRSEFSKRVAGLGMAAKRITEEEQIDELRRSTILSYIKKATKTKATPENISKRSKGLSMASKKLEETQLDEISKETIGKYIPAAAKDLKNIGLIQGAHRAKNPLPNQMSGSEDQAGKYHQRLMKNRLTGISKATKKLTKEDSSFNAALVTGKTVNEVAVDMATPPAFHAPAPSRPGARQTTAQRAPTGYQGPRQVTTGVRGNVNLGSIAQSPGVKMQQGMASAGRAAASSRSTVPAPPVSAGPRSIGGIATQAGSIASKLPMLARGAAGIAAAAAAAPIVAKVAQGVVPGAMKQQYGSAHKSMVPHDETPTDRKSFDRMRQMGAKPTPVNTSKTTTNSNNVTPSKTVTSFKQAFAQARAAAGGGKGQFEFGGKKYQTNIAPAKGSEKYVAPSSQKQVSSISKQEPTVAQPEPKTQTPGPTVTNAKVTTNTDTKGKMGDYMSPGSLANKSYSLPPAKPEGNMSPEKMSNITPEKKPAKLQEEVMVGANKYRIF